ncbi:MAG: hypothetical protein JW757_01910 [Anaerolineales bacterium]|nr:hypothetical protein [Anaerolineales bacterium]
MDDNRRFPNLFWPIIFIGVGVLYLLSNLSIIEMINFYEIWRLWPVFLVIAGINMLFGRNNRWLASLLSGLMALVVVGFLFFAPMVIETLPAPERQTERFQDAERDVQAVDVFLDFDRGNIEVFELVDSRNLFEAEVTHNQHVTFNASGSNTRDIRLRLDQVGPEIFSDWLTQSQIRAEVGLATDVPIDLDVNIGGGSADMDLTAITLDKLKADSGSGSISVNLPEGDFLVDLSSGSGSVTVMTGEDSKLDMKINVGSGKISVRLGAGCFGEVMVDSGSGLITLVVPEGTAVQLRGDTGSGSVNVPSGFIQTSGGDDIVGASGVWETAGFDQAKHQLVICFDIGSGSIRVQYP